MQVSLPFSEPMPEYDFKNPPDACGGLGLRRFRVKDLGLRIQGLGLQNVEPEFLDFRRHPHRKLMLDAGTQSPKR